ncbi:MAG: dephospho-CoA kinase [Sphingomonadales bacterium]
MYILGLTGSMAMGKTTVTKMFEENGVPAFHADEAVHLLFQKSKRLRGALGVEFPGVVKDEQVNREKLSTLVFGNPDRLARLELIIHPFVFREVHKFLKMHRAQGAPVVILDLPLLFEIKAEDICDGVLVVTATPEVQKNRAKERANFSEKNFQDRLARQMPDGEKRKRATFLIDTGISLDKTRADVKKIIAKLAT